MGDGGLSAGGALGAYFQDNLNEIKKHNMYLVRVVIKNLKIL